jgi:cytochrome c-type biogenesis protein CcmH/NrfG
MLWKADKREESIEAYNRIIGSSKLLGSVIPDLKEHLEQAPSADLQQALGDAYMKDGQLQNALDTYRQALKTL